MSCTELRRQVVNYINHERLLSPGDRVVVGVSGGPDSLCLMHVLWTCRKALGVELHLAHLNHLIRGADADADAGFCDRLAAGWDIPCTVQARDVPRFARERKLAIEEAARRVRYAFLADVARKVGAAKVAVAHNADDQSETVLMHWLRGAGLAGLRGMLPATRMADLRLLEGPAKESVWLVRPLLEVERAEIEHYCEEHGLAPRFDRSNLDTTLYRNKLRHELLPHLEREFKPRFKEILRRSARVIRDDYDLLYDFSKEAWLGTTRQVTDVAVTFDREAWLALHPSLQRATLRQAIQHLRWNLRDVGFKHIEAAVEAGRCGRVGAKATLPRGVVLTVSYDTIVVANAGHTRVPDFPALTVKRLALIVPGVTPLPGGGEVNVEVVLRNELPAHWSHNPDPWLAFLDAEAVGRAPFLSQRRVGDRFCPLGMGQKHKLVSELLVNEKVPTQWRDLVPLLMRGDGEIMWVCGWRIDERAKITEETARVMVIHLRMAE